MVSDHILPWVTTLGEAVRERRKSRGLTQEDLALLADCGKLFVVRLEAGRPTARLDVVIRVLTALGLELRIVPGNRGIAE